MSFNIHQLDHLDYDDIEPIFDGYISDAIEAFADSPEGEAYAKTHEEFGGWIGTFIEMAYLYGEFKLPMMTKGDVQTVMETILPRRLTLMDASQADDAIPELIAFWKFLKRAYKLRSAGAIAQYLKTLELKFPTLINDPASGGIAKQFFMAGQAAGFDMTTEEGIKAYQDDHNRAIRETGINPFTNLGQDVGSNLGGVPIPAQFLERMMGSALPSTDQKGALEQLLSILGAIAGGRTDSLQLPVLGESIWEQIHDQQMGAIDVEPLSTKAIALLTEQTITPTTPGTILQDFQTLLDCIGEQGIPVSAKLNQFPAKSVVAINEQLSNPIQVDLKRPVQKSYPSVHGLYLLLRATGLGQLKTEGKNQVMHLNPSVLKSWNQLNFPEKYFTLLEAWLLRSHAEMLGDSRTGGLNEGSRVLHYWNMSKKAQTYKNYKDQNNLNYFPELHHLALMELFGLVQITTGNPEPGKGWRVKKIQKLSFGDAVLDAIRNAYIQHGMIWESEENLATPFGELQSTFQPYFPEWKNNLDIPQHEFRSGIHTFKVTLQKAWRRIEISGNATLFDLSRLILKSVDFDTDHLDMFTYKGYDGRTVQISHPMSESPPFSNEVRVGELPLEEGSIMRYVFDFGDWWKFKVQLESVQPGKSKVSHGKIIERHGKAPEQYPDYDEY